MIRAGAILALVALPLADRAGAESIRPALLDDEMEALAAAVEPCWPAGNGAFGGASRGATEDRAEITVVVAFTRDGRVTGPIEPALRATESLTPAREAALKAARRALTECEGGGYPLPEAYHEGWKTLRLTFDAEGRLLR